MSRRDDYDDNDLTGAELRGLSNALERARAENKQLEKKLDDVAGAVHGACVEMMRTHCPTSYEADVLKRIDVKRIVADVLKEQP